VAIEEMWHRIEERFKVKPGKKERKKDL